MKLIEQKIYLIGQIQTSHAGGQPYNDPLIIVVNILLWEHQNTSFNFKKITSNYKWDF